MGKVSIYHGVEKDFYDGYFDKCEFAFGTLIYRSFTFTEFPLNEINKLCSGFTPPQATINWREDWYLNEEWIHVLSESRNELLQAERLTKQLNLFTH